MVYHTDYAAYHIMRALYEGGDMIAREIQEKYNKWAERGGQKPVAAQRIGVLIVAKLSPGYVTVCGERKLWAKSKGRPHGKGVHVYRLTAQGRDFVERYAYWGA